MEDFDFSITYQFSDYLAWANELHEPGDFVNEVSFAVNIVDDEGNHIEEAARGLVSQILFGLAMDSGYPLYQVMDATSSLLEMSEIVFDWEEGSDPWAKIDQYYNEPLIEYNVCFLERIEILPMYRKLGLTKRILRNLNTRFYNACGLWVLKAFPLQHDSIIRSDTNQWTENMQYDRMETDIEKSQYKLYHLYQSLGFVNPFDQRYFIARSFDLIHKLK